MGYMDMNGIFVGIVGIIWYYNMYELDTNVILPFLVSVYIDVDSPILCRSFSSGNHLFFFPHPGERLPQNMSERYNMCFTEEYIWRFDEIYI